MAKQLILNQVIAQPDQLTLLNRSHQSLIHPDSVISDFVEIGHGSKVNGPALIDASPKARVIIGRYCDIAHNVRIRATNHSMNYANIQYHIQDKCGFSINKESRGDVQIHHNVWLGDNVVVLPGARIGSGACIGAGAIVTKEIPAFSVAVGAPARVIRYRFSDEIIRQLLEIQWWYWSEAKIARNRTFFETDFTTDQTLDLFSLIHD